MKQPKFVVRRPSDGIYDYQRRVPKIAADLDPRKVIRVSLQTRDLELAEAKAKQITASLDKYWAALAAGKEASDAWEEYAAAVRLTHALGMSYKSRRDILEDPIEAHRRVMAARAVIDEPDKVKAITGVISPPRARLSDVWKLYERHNADFLAGYSDNQRRKHRVSRQRAIKYARDVLGNPHLDGVSRDDVLFYRDWWVEKIAREGLKADSANRSFTDLRGMLSVIDAATRSNYVEVWKGIAIKATAKTKTGRRPAYSNEFVQTQLLKPGALDSLNVDARLIVYVMVETGMRLSETCNLRPNGIHLDAEIPYIEIEERDDRLQKTEYSIRTIPLVGVSLWAMRHAPEGFPRYHDREDSLSNAINKQLRALNLQPTKKHSVYSLRHTFQDRILATNAPDRLQTDLMGHEFDRPKYGEGSTLKMKRDLLEKIRFKWDNANKLAPQTQKRPDPQSGAGPSAI